MSVDRKYAQQSAKKRKFRGNRPTLKARIASSECLLASVDNETENVHDVSSVSENKTGTKPKATPTRSEMKIEDLYKIMEDSDSDTDSSEDGGDSDSEYNVLDDGQVLLEGNRVMIDIDILSRNIITSKLVCGFCHHTVQFVELKRQGLGCEFAFHCSNRACNKQTSFPSRDMIPVGNNLTKTLL